MGSPLSPIITDLVLLDLETRALKRFGFEVPFYIKYVDDIATAVHRTQLDKLLNIFNSFHPRIQFTMEIGGNILNFLDVTLIKNNNKIEFDWFHKPTFSGRYLNFLSLHPITQKRGSLMSMIDRALLLSHPRYHNKNINFIINTFLRNDYPFHLIFDKINLRLKTMVNKRNNTHTNNENNNNISKINWFTIPYFPNISERFKNIVKNQNVKLSFDSLNKLNGIIKAQKNRLPDYSKKNVVYKISCNDCDAIYVGQTKRKLNTRITEHRNQINSKSSNKTVITEHGLRYNHKFVWTNVKILDKETFYWKRIISEMLNIRSQNNALNCQTDIEYLDNTYTSILNKL